jgi:formyltetrahydrofolate-dependent phosphoribosylglycinamide formyltransferase
MTSLAPARLVVLISGNGSNLQALIDAYRENRMPARVVAVFSNKTDAYGLERARRVEIPALAVPKPRDQERRDYDAWLAARVAEYRPDWVVLAGWMRILSSAFLARFPNRVINIHPALPGAFPGTGAIERAYQAYQQGSLAQTGVMIHRVPDEGVDDGPVLGLETVPIQPGDTLETLETRVHAVEHRLLVETICKIIAYPDWRMNA